VTHSYEKSFGLKDLSERFLKDPKERPYVMIHFDELFARKTHKDQNLFPSLSPDEPGVVNYACSDAICTHLLCQHPVITEAWKDKKYSFTYRLEKQTVQAVRLMERYRVEIDRAMVQSVSEEAAAELASYDSRIQALASSKGFHDFNAASGTQLSDFLFSEQGLNLEPKPPKTEKSGKYKTDAKTLEGFIDEADLSEEEANDHVLVWIIRRAQISKILGTYLVNMLQNSDERDQLRFNFKQTGAATGRFSAPDSKGGGYSGIPIQGIPARTDPKRPKCVGSQRKIFRSRQGYTMCKCDYAGQELRIVTNVTGEPAWVKEFEHGDGDLHTLTAMAFFGKSKENVTKEERRMGKCVHPDTLVFSGGRYVTVGSLGSFPEVLGTFTGWSGTLYDGREEQPATHLYNGGTRPLFHVVTTGGIVTCTGTHQLLLADGSWVQAQDLKAGMSLEVCSMPVFMGKLTEETSYADIQRSAIPSWAMSSKVGALLYLGRLFSKGYLETDNFVFAGQVATLLRASGSHLDIELDDEGYLKLTPVKDCPKSAFEVRGVVPAEASKCLDVSMGTFEHKYFANGLVTHNTANFALVYGGGVGAIQRATGCNMETAKIRKSAFDKSVPVFSKWVQSQRVFVKKNLGVVNAFGRFIGIPDRL
jgi:hypothetical protein